jgi:hypothetical protein
MGGEVASLVMFAAQDLFDTPFYLYGADRHAGGGTIGAVGGRRRLDHPLSHPVRNHRHSET